MKEIKHIAVIGAGIMGSGIAKAIFKHNIDVTLYDSDQEQLNTCYDAILAGARRSMDLSKIHKEETLEQAVRKADLIIEAVVEEISVKCSLFKELDTIAPGGTIFASNTSSLDIEEMTEASGRPDRFLGLHFFNPAFLMRLVEVITPDSVSDSTKDSIFNLLKRIRKTGISCKPSPGFIVNRILIPTLNEAFWILGDTSDESNRIDVANDIDTAITADQLFLLGVFDLADLTGLDTALAVAQRIYTGLNNDPRYIPSPLLEEYVSDSLLGRKVKRGIYHYKNRKNDPEQNPRCNSQGEPLSPVASPTFAPLALASVIINEALRIIEEGVSESYADIDFCMESAALWPSGPFKLLKHYSIGTVQEYLQKQLDSSAAERYIPSALLTTPPPELTEYLAGLA